MTRSKYTPRVGFNTANVKAANKLMDVFFDGFAICETCGERFYPAAYESIDNCASCRSNTMAIHGATPALLQSILDTTPALKGVRLVIATDYPAELADEMREPEEEDEVPYGCCPVCGDVLTTPNRNVCQNCGHTLFDIFEDLKLAKWLGVGDQAALAYGDADLGTHTIVSGGEVLERDAQTPAGGDEEGMLF